MFQPKKQALKDLFVYIYRNENRKMKIKEVHIRWVGIPLLAVFIAYFMKNNHPAPFVQNLLITLFFTTFFWNGAILLFYLFRKKFPLIKDTPKRLILTIVTLSVFLLVGGNLFRGLLKAASWSEIFTLSGFFEHAITNFTAAFFVGSIYESVYFFNKWKETIQINEALKNQQIRTQFEVLQNQMSPHFLFNSLNTLTTLIAENADIAIEFTQRLSDVYRYILQNKEKELVLLKDEISFVKDYIYLLQMRYPENLKTTFDVDEVYLDKYIAPLTIQMLVENAIKHNVISNAQPLNIEIYIENGSSLIVKNNLQPKKIPRKSTKTGLENIKKRYKYLGNREIAIINTPLNYLVAVPIIELVKESDYLPKNFHESIDN